MITVRAFGEVREAPGTVLYASAEAKHIYRFDASGKVIRA